MSSPPSHPLLASSSPTMPINACGPYPPRLPPRLSCRTTGRGLRVGCGVFGCLSLPCLPVPCRSSPRVNWRGAAGFSPRHLVRPCLLSCADGRRACAMAPCGVAFSCFPVGAFQSFLKCFPVNVLKSCGYPMWLGSPRSVNTGGVPVAPCRSVPAVPVCLLTASHALPPHPPRRLPYPLLRSSRFSPPPARHGWTGRRPRAAPLLARRNGGRSGAPVVVACPCVPRIARRLAAFRIAAALPFPHDIVARLFPSCPHSSIAPSNRHEGRGAGRGGCLFGDDVRRMKKAGGCSFPVRLLRFYRV